MDVERFCVQAGCCDNATGRQAGRQATLFDQWRCATGQQPTRMRVCLLVVVVAVVVVVVMDDGD